MSQAQEGARRILDLERLHRDEEARRVEVERKLADSDRRCQVSESGPTFVAGGPLYGCQAANTLYDQCFSECICAYVISRGRLIEILFDSTYGTSLFQLSHIPFLKQSGVAMPQ